MVVYLRLKNGSYFVGSVICLIRVVGAVRGKNIWAATQHRPTFVAAEVTRFIYFVLFLLLIVILILIPRRKRD